MNEKLKIEMEERERQIEAEIKRKEDEKRRIIEEQGNKRREEKQRELIEKRQHMEGQGQGAYKAKPLYKVYEEKFKQEVELP